MALPSTSRISRRQVLRGAGLLAAGGPGGLSCRHLFREPEPPRYDHDDIVDVHCHVFNATDLPVTGFIAHSVPGLSDLSRELTDVPETVVRAVVGLLHQGMNHRTPDAAAERRLTTDALTRNATIPPVGPSLLGEGLLSAVRPLLRRIAAPLEISAQQLDEVVGRIVDALNLVTQERARIAATLVTDYPTVKLFTPCLVDYDAWSADKPQTPLREQIELHAAVARLSIRGLLGRADARVHPFIAFDPLREVEAIARHDPDAGGVALVRQAVLQAGFVGAKVYPPVGFLPLGNANRSGRGAEHGARLDEALRAFYRFCETEEVPITAHASPTNGYANGLGNFAAPANWRPVLAEFPRLRLNFGHMGHLHGDPPAPTWMEQAADLMRTHATVFADMSNSPLVYDEGYEHRFIPALKALIARYPGIERRLMYGSDWWLNRLGPRPTEAAVRFTAVLERELGAGIRKSIMGANALRFLGFIDDENRMLLSNRNSLRLRAFYKPAAPPRWLAA